MNKLNTKALAVAVVAVLVVGGVGALYFTGAFDRDVDREINIVSQVNIEGSEIFIKESLDENDFAEFDSGKFVDFKKDGWGGKIFRTPGASTIQHIMLKKIVVDLGLEFEKYSIGTPLNDNTVYYIEKGFNKTDWEDGSKADGGIIWQPVCQEIIQESSKVPAKLLVSTKDFAPEHACCVVAANHSFATKNPEAVSAFLAAYKEANDWVNNSDKWDELVELSKKITGKSQPVVEAALKDVVYVVGDEDNPDAPLSKLKDDTVDLIKSLDETGGILRRSLAYLGFEGENAANDFAERFVQDSYLSEALKNPDIKVDGKKKINVRVINGDIHQIVLHVAAERGIFEEHGIEVNIAGGENGPAVATSLQNGGADIGLLGLPPITITTINGSLLTA